MTDDTTVSYLTGGEISNRRREHHPDERGIRSGAGGGVLGQDPVRDCPAPGRFAVLDHGAGRRSDELPGACATQAFDQKRNVSRR